MKVAVIDCGTNTFHLLIAETKTDGGFDIFFKENVAVKLGENGITNKLISEIPFQRGISTLKNFKKSIQQNNVKEVRAYATAALRMAANGNDFLIQAKNETGFTINLIDGQKEAELIYLGVRQAVKMTDEKVLILDIGGGSVEFIIANKNEIFSKQSFEIGAALLLEKFKPSDPVKSSEIEIIKNYLESVLLSFFEELETKNQKPETLVGCSGSFETFADLVSNRFSSPAVTEKNTEYDIRLNEFLAIHDQLIHTNSEQRMNMKGMIPMRVDMIVIASILTTFVLGKTNITKIKLSTFALKEGALFGSSSN